MAVSPVEALRNARALITDPAKWTQRAHAEDSFKNYVALDSERAACWCGDGALAKCAGVTVSPENGWENDDVYDDAYPFLDDAVASLTNGGSHSIATINDGDVHIPGKTPHEAVLAAFDLAITKAERAFNG